MRIQRLFVRMYLCQFPKNITKLTNFVKEKKIICLTAITAPWHWDKAFYFVRNKKTQSSCSGWENTEFV